MLFALLFAFFPARK
jgi:hypothetical protein